MGLSIPWGCRPFLNKVCPGAVHVAPRPYPFPAFPPLSHLPFLTSVTLLLLFSPLPSFSSFPSQIAAMMSTNALNLAANELLVRWALGCAGRCRCGGGSGGGGGGGGGPACWHSLSALEHCGLSGYHRLTHRDWCTRGASRILIIPGARPAGGAGDSLTYIYI